jgi:hypothetical protein
MGQTTNQIILKAIDKLLKTLEVLKPVKRSNIYIRICVARLLLLSGFCIDDGLAFPQLVDFALRKSVAVDQPIDLGVVTRFGL